MKNNLVLNLERILAVKNNNNHKILLVLIIEIINILQLIVKIKDNF